MQLFWWVFIKRIYAKWNGAKSKANWWTLQLQWMEREKEKGTSELNGIITDGCGICMRPSNKVFNNGYLLSHSSDWLSMSPKPPSVPSTKYDLQISQIIFIKQFSSWIGINLYRIPMKCRCCTYVKATKLWWKEKWSMWCIYWYSSRRKLWV